MTNHHLNSQVLQAITALSNQLIQTEERLTKRMVTIEVSMESINKRVTANERRLNEIHQKVNKYATKIKLKSEGPFKAQADIKMLNPLQIEIKNRYLQFHIRHHTSLIEQIKKQQILMIYRLFQMTSIWIISFSLMF